MIKIDGTSRRVYLGKKNVFKVPILEKKSTIWMINYLSHRFINEMKATHSLKESLRSCERSGRTYSNLKGLFDNWYEEIFSAKLGDLVVPVKLSLFGFLNIMDRGAPCTIPHLGKEFRDGLEHLGIHDHTHTFENPDHFVWHKGKIKVCDYGSFKTAMFLLENKKICRKLLDQIAENYQATKNVPDVNNPTGPFAPNAI